VNVLVDASIWSLALRRPPKNLNASEKNAVSELAELIDEGRAKMIGPVRQELLSGIRDAAQFERLRNYLRAFSDETIMSSDYEAAASAGNLCRAKGIAVSPADILISAIAVSRPLSIFSNDPDFHRYSRVLPVRLHARR
jgi:predicted nucleic acid-binding protein